MPLLLSADHIHDMRPVGIPGMGLYRGREEEEMRELFISRYGREPGPIELDSRSAGARQEA